MSDGKETRLAGKMRALAREDALSADHPLYVRAAALDIAAAKAFAPGGAPGAHRAFRAATDDARRLFRAYRLTRHRR